jgi:hypothetical protein
MKKCLLCCFFLFLVGCELVVDIDVPFEQGQLTLNSLFHKDSLWSVHVSLNQHILDEATTERVRNATVVVYKNEIPIDTLSHVSNGLYRSDTAKPEIGQSYKITVSAPGHEDAFAHSHIPLPTTITHVDVNTTEDESTIRVKFSDDPDEVNYYQIILEQEGEFIDWQNGNVVTSRGRVPIETNDPSIENDEYIGYNGFLIRDIFFQNEGVVSFTTFNSQHSGMIVTVRTVSEDYYRYKTTGDLQEETSGSPFAQPVNVYKNIINGFGIFAGYSESGYAISGVEERPVINSISPSKGKPGDRIVITGNNFIGNISNSGYVVFAGLQTPAYGIMTTTPTESQIEITVPQNAVTGKIYVSNGSKIAASDVEFEVER